MKVFGKIAVIGASSFLMTTAFADTSIYNPNAKNSFYISGEAGVGFLATPDKNVFSPNGVTVSGASHDNGGKFAGSVNLGYNRLITNHVLAGLELGYDDNGRSRYTEAFTSVLNNASVTYKIRSTDWHLLATGTYLWANGINVFAKAGAAQVDQKLKINQNGALPFSIGNETSDVQYKPMVAAGVGYQIKMVNLYVQYSHIFGQNADNFSDLFNSDGTFAEVVSVDTVKAGLAFNIAI